VDDLRVTWAAAESLMKLAPVNGVNVCELVFVSKTNVLALALTFGLFIR